jgi:predicted dinucleotide-binding enzyme
LHEFIGIIGAGNIGKAIARHFINRGFPVLISNSKDPASLAESIVFWDSG